jgi:uncharacterized protein (TIGR00251 family)
MLQGSLFMADLPFEEGFLYIHATPKASKNRLGSIVVDENGRKWIKIYVTAIAENNKANEAIIKFLSDILNISKTSLTIVQGHTSRRKVLKKTTIDQ